MLSWRVRCCLVKFLPLLARVSDKSKDSQSGKAGVGRGESPGLSVGNLRAIVGSGLDDVLADGVADEARRVVDVQLLQDLRHPSCRASSSLAWHRSGFAFLQELATGYVVDASLARVRGELPL